jgi:hypothetical protein
MSDEEMRSLCWFGWPAFISGLVFIGFGLWAGPETLAAVAVPGGVLIGLGGGAIAISWVSRP